MFNRVEYKMRAKAVLAKNYWTCFLVTLIVLLLGGKTPQFKFDFNIDAPKQSLGYLDNIGAIAGTSIPGLLAGMAFLGSALVFFVIFAIVLQIFIVNILEVGKCRYFIEASKGNYDFGNLAFGFKQENYRSFVLTIFLRNLYIFLWSLLLAIPGIIAIYRYRFIPYILAENPDIGYTDAFAMSKEMTKGIKMDMFIMDISFFGWRLLNIITFGIANFFIEPYVEASYAEVFREYLANYSQIN